MDCGKKIRKLRENDEPPKTQKEVAEILGITQKCYSEYENGERKLKIKHLVKLCEIYGVSADYILGLPENLKYLKR